MKQLKAIGPIVGALLVVIGAFWWGSHRHDAEIRALNARIAASSMTIETKQGLYETALGQVDDVKSLLDSSSKEVKELKDQLDQMRSKVLTVERVTVQLKSPISSATTATQTLAPSFVAGGRERQRVDFAHDFGPFKVMGHTLTDPAEGFVTLSQGRPLSLTVAVARNKDGTWSSLITSSEPDIGVNVTLGAVDPGVISPSWYQRIWAIGSLSALPSPGASLSVDYVGDRFLLGPSCQAWNGGWGCGLSVGTRIFR